MSSEYKATLTFTSRRNDEAGQEDMDMRISFEPSVSEVDYTELGYVPLSHLFVERYILPLVLASVAKHTDVQDAEIVDLHTGESTRVVN